MDDQPQHVMPRIQTEGIQPPGTTAPSAAMITSICNHTAQTANLVLIVVPPRAAAPECLLYDLNDSNDSNDSMWSDRARRLSNRVHLSNAIEDRDKRRLDLARVLEMHSGNLKSRHCSICLDTLKKAMQTNKRHC